MTLYTYFLAVSIGNLKILDFVGNFYLVSTNLFEYTMDIWYYICSVFSDREE